MTVKLTIHSYESEDASTTIVPAEDELEEMRFRLQWLHKNQEPKRSEAEHRFQLRRLERFGEDCAVLRPLCQIWNFNITIPCWDAINQIADSIPQERRTADRVTTALLPVFSGMGMEQLNEVPVPILLKIKQEIWLTIRPVEMCSADHRCMTDYLFGNRIG